jgi:hypothetical protein
LEKTTSSNREGFEEPAALLILNLIVDDSWRNLLLPDLLIRVSDDEGLGFIKTPSWRMLKAESPEAGEY